MQIYNEKIQLVFNIVENKILWGNNYISWKLFMSLQYRYEMPVLFSNDIDYR